MATMRIVMIGMWGLRIPAILAAIHVLGSGPAGIWWAMALSIACLTVMMVHRFRSGVWTKASVDKDSKTMLWETCLERGKNSDFRGKPF